MNNWWDISLRCDSVHVRTDAGRTSLEMSAEGTWAAAGVEVSINEDPSGQQQIVVFAENVSLEEISLTWKCPIHARWRFLGDHWERGYGDLEWRGVTPGRVMPWYFLASDGRVTHAIGVMTGCAAICSWRAEDDQITLVLDVRCGGVGVKLGSRQLNAATIIRRTGTGTGTGKGKGTEGETPFTAARAFCSQLCPRPMMPNHPVYGGNDWYYAYGDNSSAQILADAERIRSWSPAGENRPYMVIDDGWQICRIGNGYLFYNGGPWHQGNRFFPDMPGLAANMKKIGVRPGIWLRPLLTIERVPPSWLLADKRFGTGIEERQPILDPSLPDVLQQVHTDVRRLKDWGFELIKHDWTTHDLLGRWGFEMSHDVTAGGWSFADRSRTTAEIILDLYRTIRDAAGDALIIGCNTIGHLAAGLVEMQRTGDDTSGQEWDRTRKMGVNTLAFRMSQHGTFFSADADCVGLTTKIPWNLNRQWLDLLARSGTPLFVSASPDAVGAEQTAALRAAFASASQQQNLGEPLDWMDGKLPKRWNLNGNAAEFDWYSE